MIAAGRIVPLRDKRRFEHTVEHLPVCPIRKEYPSSKGLGTWRPIRAEVLSLSTFKCITKCGESSEPTSPQTLNATVVKQSKISDEINAEKDLHKGCLGKILCGGKSAVYLEPLKDPENGRENSTMSTLRRIHSPICSLCGCPWRSSSQS